MERKSYGFKAALEQNVIKGGPAVIGNMDEGQDVIFPGAFKPVLKRFLASGFVAFGHEWDDLPIAYPIVAREEGRRLYSEAQFHSTQRAQDARTVAKERTDAGLEVPLSIGFMVAPDGQEYFDGGEMLLIWAKDKGYDMALFDEKSILACEGWCRGITRFEDLYEWSYVNAAMNRDAMADGVKRAWTYEEAEQKVWRPGVKPIEAETQEQPDTSTPAEQSKRLDIIRSIAKLSDAETVLRDVGFSGTESKALIARLKAFPRDVASDDAGTQQDEPEDAADTSETPVETKTEGETAPIVSPAEDAREEPETKADAPSLPEDPLLASLARMKAAEKRNAAEALHEQQVRLRAVIAADDLNRAVRA